MGKLTDIKVGLPSRRMSKHTLDYSANMTMNFGEVSSLGFIEMDGNSKAKGSIKSLVRMSPLPLPTFGELSYKTYARFVPIKDVYRNFENLRGARSLTTQFGTFTPTQVPSFKICDMARYILLAFCKHCVYDDSANSGSETYDTQNYPNSIIYEDFKIHAGPTDQLSAFNSTYSTALTNASFNANINPQNADFVIGVSSDQISTLNLNISPFVICFRLTRLGKIIYRNLVSLGWKFDLDNDAYVSALPFLSFYKGYWDLFMPANTANSNNNYTDTYAYRVCDYCSEHDTKDVFNSDSTIASLWAGFLSDLSKVFYYQDPDFITSMIASPSISPSTNPGLSLSDSLTFNSSATSNSSSSSNSLPYLSSSNLIASSSNKNTWSALNIKLALRLLPYVNKDTIIGGKLRELIKSRFGYDVETLEGMSYTAGRYNLPIQISALTNSADTLSSDGTSGQVLGQQGGLGVAYTKDECLKFNFKAKEYGYLLFYCVIVPKAGFFQGINPALKHGTKGRFSIYDPAFDSLGFDLYTKDIVLSDTSVLLTPQTNADVTYFPSLNFGTTAFGFSPRYFDYKNKAHSIVSGDLARLQYRDKYSPYYLDKFITPNTIESDLTDNGSVLSNTYTIRLTNNRSNIPTATPQLRQIGYVDWLENFNRIFYSYSLMDSVKGRHENYYSFTDIFGVDDNFVGDNLIKVDYFDHSKPSSESFETDGEGSSMDVSHA